jgi:hypothetical protein
VVLSGSEAETAAALSRALAMLQLQGSKCGPRLVPFPERLHDTNSKAIGNLNPLCVGLKLG